MDYLHRHLDKRLDPRLLLPAARSAIVVASVYKQAQQHRARQEAGITSAPLIPELVQINDRQSGVAPDRATERSHGWSEAEPVDRENQGDFRPGRGGGSGLEPQGRVAMYAWGEDYHRVVRDKLRQVEAALRSRSLEPFDSKICVDTVPIIERELAAAAGVGWIGRNTLVMHPDLGSYFFLGVLLTTLDIAPDEPLADHCGTCTACLDACPTQAFPAPYQMDASRCISYLTIEHRGDISRPFQELMGEWIFGCDVCQEVCPHNRKAPDTREPRFAARTNMATMNLNELLNWNEADYENLVRDSALSRARLEMLKRNALIVRENISLHRPGDHQSA